MYRKLKNILGVSFIILAIVLAQIPMGDVFADEEVNTESSEEVSTELESTVEESEESVASEDNVEVGEIALLAEEEQSTTETTTETTTVEIYYNLGFDGVTLDSVVNQGSGVKNGNTITFSDVSAGGVTVPLPQTIKISGIDEPQELVKDSKEYTINNVKYYFKGWFEEGQGQEFNFSVPATGNKTIKATWAPVVETPCKVTFVATGFKPETQYITVNAGDTVPEPKAGTEGFQVPMKTGSEITGWKDEQGNKIEAWDFVIDRDRTFTAIPDTSSYEVIFHMQDGATYDGKDTHVVKVSYGETIPTNELQSLGSVTNKDFLTDTTWYTDVNCTTPFIINTPITQKTDLYKKWYRILDLDGVTAATKGFHISANEKILYKFDGNIDETGAIHVVIPNSVTTIVPDAFPDMTSIESVTLPSNIGDVMGDAFSGMNKISRTVTLKGSSSQASEIGNQLAVTYPNFVYMSSQTGSEGVVVNPPLSSLYDSNTAEGNTGFNTYVSVRPPKLPDGTYSTSFTPYVQGNSNFPQLVEAEVRITDPARFFYMNIDFNKDGAPFDGYNAQEVFKVSLPLPAKWQTKKEIDVDGKIRVFTTKYNVTPKALEEIDKVDVVKHDASGVYCVEFETWHFSEYVIVYSGSMEDRVENNNTNTTPGNTNPSQGGNNNNNSGGSNNSGSNNNQPSSSGGNSGNSGTGGGTTPSTTGTTSVTPATPVTPIVPVTPGTTPVVTPMGSGTGAQHVKDTTPKTGDPLEYRSILVCGLFSMGVLIICVGNKKKKVNYYIEA